MRGAPSEAVEITGCFGIIPVIGGKTVALSEAEGTPISAGLYSPSARTDATS